MFVDEAMFENLDEGGLEFLSSRSRHAVPPEAERIDLFREGRYGAYAHDLGFGWRWAITRDGCEIQEGSALSRESALYSARHVLAFFTRIDRRETA